MNYFSIQQSIPPGYFSEIINISLSTIQKKVAVIAIVIFSLIALVRCYHLCKLQISPLDSKKSPIASIFPNVKKETIPSSPISSITEKGHDDIKIHTHSLLQNTAINASTYTPIKDPLPALKTTEHLNGQGERTDKNGVREIGLFENDELQNGRKEYPNGKIEDGIFSFNRLVSGKRTHTDGTIEDGVFMYDFLHHGKKTYSNGKIENGEFTKDELITGTITMPNGDVQKLPLNGQGKRNKNGIQEEGIFENGVFQKGKKVYSDGKIEDGEFDFSGLVKGIKIHQGITEDGVFKYGYLLIDGKKTHAANGTIEEGKFDYPGQLINGTRTHSNNLVEKGQFKKGILFKGTMISPSGVTTILEPLNGPGKRTNKISGIIEEGLFEDDVFQEGKKTHLNGKNEEGKYDSQGLLQGEGTATYPDGIIEKGTFQAGILKDGTITYPNGCKKEGRFISPRCLDEGKKTTLSGNIFEGRFIHDEPDIQSDSFIFYGELTYSNGLILNEVRFADGILKEGIYPDGREIFGSLDINLNGKGMLTSPDHHTEKGTFLNGVFHPDIPSTPSLPAPKIVDSIHFEVGQSKTFSIAEVVKLDLKVDSNSVARSTLFPHQEFSYHGHYNSENEKVYTITRIQ